MKGMLFTQDNIRLTYSLDKTHTRRTGRSAELKRINENPNDWRMLFRDELTGGFLFKHKITGEQVIIKPYYEVSA